VIQEGRRPAPLGALFCVGGASIYYGGVSFRLREQDFEPPPSIVEDSRAEWPIRYPDLEPYYARAERIIGVSGAEQGDPTAPWRSTPYPMRAGPFSQLSERLARGARTLGLHPFPLPMAIHHGEDPSRRACIRCGACDGYACPVSAKNDLAVRVIKPLLDRGLQLMTGTAAVKLLEANAVIRGIECVDLATGRRFTVHGREVILAAGALASPHLLLASGLERHNPGGALVGRYLMRHANSVVFGYLREPFESDGLGKDLAIQDYYLGDSAPDAPLGPLGAIQSLPTPSIEVIRGQVPWPLPWIAARFLHQTAALITIAEDQPRFENRVALEETGTNGMGLPGLRITHRYTERDRAANRALRRRARGILRAAGAWLFYNHPIRTFSHALGTVRMGRDERTSPLDGSCRFRGIENLRVVDGSVFPTSAAVNPSLTIAANALRVAATLTGSRVATAAAAETA
jgi:choline dehydrogenase-like flavoprotein